MTFDFARPQALLLLLLLIPVVLWWRRSRTGLPPGRARLVLATRVVMVALLVLSLAGIRLLRPTDRLCVVFVVDASLSATDAQQAWARRYVAQSIVGMRPQDAAGIVVFGRDAWFERAPGPVREDEVLDAPFTTVVARDYTDLGRALLLAQGAFPEGVQRRIVLISDGNENLGDAVREAAAAGERGIPVWTLAYPARTLAEARVDDVVVPDSVRRDEPFDVRVQVHSALAADATLVVQRNGRLLGRVPVSLKAGDNVFFLPQRVKDAGAYAWTVTVELPADANPRNNAGSGLALVRGRPRVLYVHGGYSAPGFLPAMLRAQGLDVDVATARRMPSSLAELEHYAAVVLSDVNALELSEDGMRQLASYVRDLGGGLVMLGGPNSFGVGGWQGTPVADVLPVLLEVRKRKYMPTVAMVLVIDKSGSMGETVGKLEKIAVAREAAIASIELLRGMDRIGVVAFDEAAKWVVPMKDADQQDAIKAEIATLRAGGGTDLYPGLLEASKALEGTRAVIKHAIVLSDGRTAPGDFDRLVARMKKAGITVSAVGIGADADQRFLHDLAKHGGGRSYFTDNAMLLPRIFARDTLLASKSALHEEPFVPQTADTHTILRGVGGAFPPLDGYVITTPRGGARTPLVATQGDPLLAAWRVGLGKTVAITTDDGRRWARGWSSWPKAAALYVQAVRWTFSDVPASPFRLTTETRGSTVQVSVDAVDEQGGLRNFLALDGVALDPSGKTQPVRLEQTGPGRYQGTFELGAPGSYLLSVVDPGTGQQRKLPVVFPYSPEFRSDAPDRALLERIASVSGGRLDAPAAAVFEREGSAARVPQDGWSLLALMALLLFPLDIALRRVFLPAGWPAAVAAVLRRQPVAPAASGQRETLAALKTKVKAPRAGAGAVPAPPTGGGLVQAPSKAPSPAPAPGPAEPEGGTLARLKQRRRERRKE